MATLASSHAISQYSNTSDKLAARLAIHNYNTHPQHWFEWVGSRIVKEGKILEVGAGTGELWTRTPLPSSGDNNMTSLVLTDFSEAMCNQMRTSVLPILEAKVNTGAFPSRGSEKEDENIVMLPNVQIQQASATHLPFPDQSFDSVIANHMLYHIDEPHSALSEFHRVLRPGGTVHIALNGMDHLDELLEVGRLMGRPSEIKARAKISAENARGYLEKWFIDVSEEQCPGAFETNTVGPVIEYIESLDDVMLSEDQKKLGRSIVEEVLSKEGVFKIKKRMVLFKGRKGEQILGTK